MLIRTKLILVSLFSLILIDLIEGELYTCPRFCKCDLYRQLNRAQCSSKHLISAEVEAPRLVQILDLSYNDVTTIDSGCLKKYPFLKYLNLSHNAIQSLDLKAFTHLKSIVEIDLSYNRLEYLDDRLFEWNHHLETLNLEGNKFMSISLNPLLRSTSLLQLNLKNSQLNFVHHSIFTGIPSLVELDLSQNLLNTLRLEDFKGLKHLRTLSFSGNVLKCDQATKEKLKQFKNLGIDVLLDDCQEDVELLLSAPSEKFQKMVKLEETNESEEINSIKQWRFDLSLEDAFKSDDDNYADESSEIKDSPMANNEWLRFAPDAVLCGGPKHQLCQSYRKCLVNLNTAWHEQRSMDSFTSGEAKFSFLLGAACGTTIVICILTCALCVKNCCESRKKDQHFRDVELDPAADMSGGQPLACPQIPPQVRRQPRRRAAPPPQRATVRYEGPVGENFISRLFGRPARHQYYRTINQNTATLIRRLSRSNLFNNRLSQHFTERQNSSDPTPTTAESQEYTASAPRPETPPPCYGDVVVNGCEGGRK